MPATPEASWRGGAESGEEALRRWREHKGPLIKLEKWRVDPASTESATGSKWVASFHYWVASTPLVSLPPRRPAVDAPPARSL
jgi:hypothetical protein